MTNVRAHYRSTIKVAATVLLVISMPALMNCKPPNGPPVGACQKGEQLADSGDYEDLLAGAPYVLSRCQSITAKYIRRMVVAAAKAPGGPERYKEITSALQEAEGQGAMSSAIKLEFDRFFSRKPATTKLCGAARAIGIEAFKIELEEALSDKALGVRALGEDTSILLKERKRLMIGVVGVCFYTPERLEEVRKILQEDLSSR